MQKSEKCHEKFQTFLTLFAIVNYKRTIDKGVETMRAISGEYGGRRLKALDGSNTRPTTDKVKEPIFNMTGPYLDGGTTLDLYSGGGGLAIEAASHGMDKSTCIEENFVALKVTKENTAVARESEKSEVGKMDANRALERLYEERLRFDLVLLDPLHAKQEIVSQLGEMLKWQLLANEAVIVCETGKTTKLSETIGTLERTREAVYEITQVMVYRREAQDA